MHAVRAASLILLGSVVLLVFRKGPAYGLHRPDASYLLGC
jgi:hypothetical protein